MLSQAPLNGRLPDLPLRLALWQRVGGTASIGGALAVLVAVTLSVGSATAQTSCDGAPVDVYAGTDALAEQTCDAAQSALGLLADCDLALTAPITITVTETAVDLPDHCVARFDCDDRAITVLHPDLLADTLSPNSRFAQIPLQPYFDSLIAHELTHATLLDDDRSANLPRVAHEYMAYATQVRSLSPEDQATFLAGAPDGALLTLSDINPLFLVFAPDLFAQFATVHFDLPENGCGFLQALLDGVVRFPAAME